MPFARPSDLPAGEPLPAWSGRLLDSATMTFSAYDITAGAAPLHEHQHEHEEVWHIVDEEQVLGAGCIAVVPPDTAPSVRPLGACRAVADYPLRPDLPGLSSPQ